MKQQDIKTNKIIMFNENHLISFANFINSVSDIYPASALNILGT